MAVRTDSTTAATVDRFNNLVSVVARHKNGELIRPGYADGFQNFPVPQIKQLSHGPARTVKDAIKVGMRRNHTDAAPDQVILDFPHRRVSYHCALRFEDQRMVSDNSLAFLLNRILHTSTVNL